MIGWLIPNVPEIIVEYYNKGYHVKLFLLINLEILKKNK